MGVSRTITLMLLLVVWPLLPVSVNAAESYDNCTGFITSVPVAITTQGTWCLNADLATGITGGSAIAVNTNNVTIDCNDFKLGGLSAGMGTQAVGVFAEARLNVTVRHCNVRGFYIGVYFVGPAGGGHAVEDSRFDGNTYEAIDVEGDGSVIRRNRVFATGGGSVTDNIYALNSSRSVDILDNTVSGTFARSLSNGSTFGIWTVNNADASIRGNRIRGGVKDGLGINVGIDNVSSERVTMRDNEVAGDASAGSIGLRCSSSSASASGNTVSGFVTPFATCSDDGGNVVKP